MLEKRVSLLDAPTVNWVAVKAPVTSAVVTSAPDPILAATSVALVFRLWSTLGAVVIAALDTASAEDAAVMRQTMALGKAPEIMAVAVPTESSYSRRATVFVPRTTRTHQQLAVIPPKPVVVRSRLAVPSKANVPSPLTVGLWVRVPTNAPAPPEALTSAHESTTPPDCEIPYR